MAKKVLDDFYLDDEDLSKTRKLELDRYQKYLKSINKYDPMDEDEYLYLTQELGTIINNNDDLDEVEVLELTRKLEKIENTKDYTIELLELTKEIKQIIKPSKKKLDIPKVEKKINPKKEQVKSLSSTAILPKINNIIRKRPEEKLVEKKLIKEDKPVEKKPEKEIKPVKKGGMTLQELVDKNTKSRGVDHFNTQAIKKIRETVNKQPVKKIKVSKKEKMVWSSIFFISLFCLVYLFIRFLLWQYENVAMKNQITDIYSMAEVNEVVTMGAVTDVSDVSVEEEVIIDTPVDNNTNYRPNDYWYYMSMSMLNVDFKELKKVNGDTKGWIQVAGTNVNYPYVHTSDNKYYLKHSFDKSYNSAGWVFLDYRNDPDNLGRNNILYAHGRLDNTMFGSLKKIVTPTWYNNSNNYVIKTSTEKENALWQVFSVYTILPESYYIKTKFTDAQFETFINTISSRSVHNFNIDVTIEDKILTLSTCYDETKRVVLHAKLIRTEEK